MDALIMGLAKSESKPIQTKFDKPEPPSLPRMVRDGVTTMRVEWDAGCDNGAPIMYYELQYKISTFQGLWMTWDLNSEARIRQQQDQNISTSKPSGKVGGSTLDT